MFVFAVLVFDGNVIKTKVLQKEFVFYRKGKFK